MQDILEDNDFIKLDTEVKGKDFTLLGYFNYEVKKIRGLKVPRGVYSGLRNYIREALIKNNKLDYNKRVYVLRAAVNFGTNDFAIFIHDCGIVIGNWKDIVPY